MKLMHYLNNGKGRERCIAALGDVETLNSYINKA